MSSNLATPTNDCKGLGGFLAFLCPICHKFCHKFGFSGGEEFLSFLAQITALFIYGIRKGVKCQVLNVFRR